MRFLGNLNEGEEFRIAHPKQPSLNGFKMEQRCIYRVTKVFPQAPYYTIAKKVVHPDESRIYSLGPRTPVIFPMEPSPTEEQVLRFIGGLPKKVVLGFRLLWDGKTDVRRQCQPQALIILKLMFSAGKDYYNVEDIRTLMAENFDKAVGVAGRLTGFAVFSFYRRRLVSLGLIEEICDDAPASEGARQANLQGVLQ